MLRRKRNPLSICDIGKRPRLSNIQYFAALLPFHWLAGFEPHDLKAVVRTRRPWWPWAPVPRLCPSAAVNLTGYPHCASLIESARHAPYASRHARFPRT